MKLCMKNICSGRIWIVNLIFFAEKCIVGAVLDWTAPTNRYYRGGYSTNCSYSTFFRKKNQIYNSNSTRTYIFHAQLHHDLSSAIVPKLNERRTCCYNLRVYIQDIALTSAPTCTKPERRTCCYRLGSRKPGEILGGGTLWSLAAWSTSDLPRPQGPDSGNTWRWTCCLCCGKSGSTHKVSGTASLE